MAKLKVSSILALCCLLHTSRSTILTTSAPGVYSRITARIDAAAVPKEHCARAIRNLQVRHGHFPSHVSRLSLSQLTVPD